MSEVLSFEFTIGKADDKQVVQTASKAIERMAWNLREVSIAFAFGGGSLTAAAAGIDQNEQWNAIFNQRLELVRSFVFRAEGNRRLYVTRGSQPTDANRLTITSDPDEQLIDFARAVAVAKRHFDSFPPPTSLRLLGADGNGAAPGAPRTALAQLEATAAHLLAESDRARKRWETDFRENEKKLLSEIKRRGELLEAEFSKRQEQLDDQEQELNKRREEWRLQASRYQILDQLKRKLADWEGHSRPRSMLKAMHATVFLLAAGLVILSGAAASYYLFQMFNAAQAEERLLAGLCQAVFLALSVAIAFFFIRWYGRWLRQLAADESRFKQLEIEILRMSWLVETAFDWREVFGTEIPESVFARLSENMPSDELCPGGRFPPADSAASLTAVGDPAVRSRSTNSAAPM